MTLDELIETESNGKRSQSFNKNFGQSPRVKKDIYTIDESNSLVLSSPRHQRGISAYNDATSSNRNNVTQIVSEGPKNMANRASFRENMKKEIKKINFSKINITSTSKSFMNTSRSYSTQRLGIGRL